MSLLLDTQALLWFLLDDPRMSETAQQSIVTTDSSIFVSPASIWEIAIKISLGKYVLPSPFAAFWEEQLQSTNCLKKWGEALQKSEATLPIFYRRI